MPRPSATRYAILGLLSLEPMSGYDIKKLVDTALRHFWSESYGRLYPTLRTLEAEGLVVSSVEAGKRRPDRVVYTITEAGLEVLRDWLTEPAELPWARVEILLKLFFAHNVPLETTIDQIQRQREGLAKRLALFDGFDRMVEESGSSEEEQRFYRLTILHGRMVTEARIRWCAAALEQLAAGRTLPEGAGS